MHFLQIWVNPSTPRLNPKYYTRFVRFVLAFPSCRYELTRVLCHYHLRHFTDAEKKDTLVKIVAPIGSVDVVDEREGPGAAPVHADFTTYASIVSPSSTVSHSFPAPADGEDFRKAYIHIVQTSGYNTKASLATGALVRVNGGLELGEGDGAFALGVEGDSLELENISETPAEILVFDLE